jgi:uncharacterized damage-inducible protein DinB
VELMVSRVAFALGRRLMSREAATVKFDREAGLILNRAEGVGPEFAARQVLIDRVRGIEDSSRNWSVLMTLDHLVIVDTSIISIIEHLVEERLLKSTVSTAAVKPEPKQTIEVVERFRRTTEDYAERIEQLPNLNSRARHKHPWFGPLNAHGWHVLAAVHHEIHRKQIERIIAVATSR